MIRGGGQLQYLGRWWKSNGRYGYRRTVAKPKSWDVDGVTGRKMEASRWVMRQIKSMLDDNLAVAVESRSMSRR